MCNLFNFDFSKIDVFAHSIPDDCKEKFCDHCNTTIKYYDNLIDKYSLKSKIENLLNNILGENHTCKIENVLNIIREIIFLHDIGKLTDDFQRKLNGENINVTHSDLSFIIIFYCIIELNYNKKIDSVLTNVLILLSYSVLKHHGKLKNIKTDLALFNIENKKSKIKNIFNKLKIKPNDILLDFTFCNRTWKRWNSEPYGIFFHRYISNNFSFFILSKLIFSLLISSDYWATMEFMKGEEFDINILNKEKTNKILKKFHENSSENNFNPNINKKKEEFLNLDLEKLKTNNYKTHDSLNEIRSFLNIKSEKSLEEKLTNNPDKKVFMLNLPTGGGKTNISLRLALKIAELKKIKKMFFVFPFINIIDQNFDVISKFLGEENVERLDTRFIPENDKLDDEFDNKDIYARFIDNQFMNKPFLFLSHVKFFDMFFKNDKNSNYNFHQLSDSIVIIDEIQAYNDKIWTEISNIILAASEYLNTHFIIMSATIPNIQSLINMEEEIFVPLFEKKFNEQLFSIEAFNRVNIKFDSNLNLYNDKKLNVEKCIDILNKNKSNNKILLVLNTVRDSFLLYDFLKEKIDDRYNLFLLNSTIIKERREEILKKCKEEGEKIILISTQSIEAGVDIDFDVGYRAYAPIDNIVQVAGRINRNNKKKSSKLVVFPDENARYVYRDSFKSKVSFNEDYVNKLFKSGDINEFKEINSYYNIVIDNISQENQNEFLFNSRSNLNNIKSLCFKEVNKDIFLIKGDTISLYIPVNKEAIDLWCNYLNFFNDELNYKKILEIKEYRKKLTKYSINIFNYYHNNVKIKKFVNDEIKYGYYYCENWEKYYGIEKGLDVDKFKKTIGEHEFEII
ncbi:MAG: CRISPR-associated helicase Cas3' [Candidatus Absconditabacterales bacterium]|nr:CRISPR-associated helicase Cas3' [Candidatus Absconditabacterales bacterium]